MHAVGGRLRNRECLVVQGVGRAARPVLRRSRSAWKSTFLTMRGRILILLSLLMLLFASVLRLRNPEPSLESILAPTNDVRGFPVVYRPQRLTMIVVFSPANCYLCLREVDLWNQLWSAYEGRLDIYGVASSPNITTLLRFIESRNIRFSVVYDSSLAMTKGLRGNSHSPMRYFFKNYQLLREDQVIGALNSRDNGELNAWIQKEISLNK